MTPSRAPQQIHDAQVHFYHVGETVCLVSNIGRLLGSPDIFQITALLPPSGGSPQYRIQAERERHERVATETDLAPVGDDGALRVRTFRHGQGTKAQQQGAEEAQTEKGARKERKSI